MLRLNMLRVRAVYTAALTDWRGRPTVDLFEALVSQWTIVYWGIVEFHD